MNPRLKAALDYAAREWPVFPCFWPEGGRCACGEGDCGSPAKHPIGKLAPNGRNSATTDREIIKGWWERYPSANVAISTGQESGLIVLDEDPRHGGKKSLERVSKTKGFPLMTPISNTGGGGHHILLARPGNGAVKTIHGLPGHPGLDLQADGAYIIAPPSLHISGNFYTWSIGPDSCAVAQIPPWLAELIKGDGGLPAAQGPVGEKIPDGQRNATLTSLAGTMRRRGMGLAAIEAALLVENARCDPPLPEQEVRAIASSVARYRPTARPPDRSKPLQTPVEPPKAPTITHSIPVFPQEVMAGAAGMFARTYAAYMETPVPFLFMDYLTILGHLVSDRITLASEIAPQPRLYTVNLGESADTRKTTSINKTSSFFLDVVNQEDINLIWGVGSAEGLAKAFGKHHRGILVLDELKAMIQKMRIDASVLLPCVNTLFELNRYHSLTKSHDITIENAQLCLLAASTLDTYRNMFTSQFLDIGFINRFFIVIGGSERRFAVPQVVPENEKEALRVDLREVLKFVGTVSQASRYALPLTSDARDIFEAWYFALEPSTFAKRLDTYGHRLMVLLAVNEMQTKITLEIAKRTVALLDYQLAARKFADPIDADNAVARLEERIRRLLAFGPLPKRELERRGSKGRVGIWAWNTAVNNLIQSKEVVYEWKTKTYFLARE